MKSIMNSMSEVLALAIIGFLASFMLYGMIIPHFKKHPALLTKAVPVAAPMASPVSAEIQAPELAAGILTLNAKNTAVFRGVVTAQSVADVESKILKLSRGLNANDTIYLVLNTPGGDVIAGLGFIDFLKALPQKVKPVVLFAASMGFQITEALDERIITPNGTLMSHRAFLGVEGRVPGELIVELNYYMHLLNRLDSNDANRMGITVKQYQDKVHDEYWVSGSEAVQDNAADTVAYIRCGDDMNGTEVVKFETPFGPASVTFSQCPIITAPLAVEMSSMKFSTPAEREEYKNYQDMLFNNENAFVHRYIITNDFKKIQK